MTQEHVPDYDDWRVERDIGDRAEEAEPAASDLEDEEAVEAWPRNDTDEELSAAVEDRDDGSSAGRLQERERKGEAGQEPPEAEADRAA